MKFKRKLIIGITGILVLGVVSALWLTLSNEKQPDVRQEKQQNLKQTLTATDKTDKQESPVKPSPFIRFSPNDKERTAYQFTLESNAEINTAAFLPEAAGGGAISSGNTLTRVHLKAEGELNLKYFSAGDGLWDVAAILASPKFDLNSQTPDYAGALSYPFCYQMNEKGELRDFRFARGMPEPAADFLKQILLSMEMVMPKEGQTQWDTQQKDMTGEYVAAYEITGKTSDDKKTVYDIQKKKEKYIKTRFPEASANQLVRKLKTEIKETETLIKISTAETWLLTMVQNEELLQTSGDTVLSKSYKQIQVNQVTPDQTITFPDNFSSFLSELDSGKYILKGMYLTDKGFDKLGEGLNTADAIQTYMNLKNSGENNAEMRSLRFMINYLRKYPDKVAELLAMLDGDRAYNQWEEATHLRLWLAIAKSGHSEAQEAIMNAARNTDYSDKTRIRAMAYVSDFEYPEDKLIDSLWNIYNTPVNSEYGEESAEKDIKAMSLLAMGILGHQENLNDQIRPVIGRKLAEALETANQPEDVGIALRAIGNYGNPELLDIVQPYLKSPDDSIRIAAYTSLRRMEDPEAYEVLIKSYQKEETPSVKKMALVTLGRMKPTNQSIEFARKTLLSVKDPEEQTVLVNFLGNNLTKYSASEKVLWQLLASNPPRNVKMAVYQYIPPN